jgi:hypothetical protein
LLIPSSHGELQTVKIETPQAKDGGRAIDTATGVSRTLKEISAALQAVASHLRDAIAAVRQPGMPLSTMGRDRTPPLALRQNLGFIESFAADITPPEI